MTGGYFDSSCLVCRELDSLVLVLSAAGVEIIRRSSEVWAKKSGLW